MLGFVRGTAEGMWSVVRGVRFVFGTRAAWLPAAMPAAVLVLLTVSGVVAAVEFIAPAVVARVALPDSSFGHALATALRFFVTVLATAVSALLAASFAPVLSAPALERIIVLRERALSLPPRPRVSLFTEIWCGLRAQLLAYTVGVPVLATLWGVTLAFPPAAVVTFPLKLATTAALLAWTLLDYPLSTRGVPLRARLVFVRRELPRVIGFTAAVFVLFAIPLGAVVLLPAAVAAATEIGVKRLTEPTRDQTEREARSV